ncbi:hypothetical protein, partial [Winslowiella iniecta]|uniref:hypothetical protein n=1 Tax=Winslowiella iniecta TaxID=1560201 RepID=UPI0019D37D6D
LESVYTATYRGFESLPHRHILKKSLNESSDFFLPEKHPRYCRRGVLAARARHFQQNRLSQ